MAHVTPLSSSAAGPRCDSTWSAEINTGEAVTPREVPTEPGVETAPTDAAAALSSITGEAADRRHGDAYASLEADSTGGGTKYGIESVTNSSVSKERIRNSPAPQSVGRQQHYLTSDAVQMHHTSSPMERTLSPVSWRHNPYAVSPMSPTIESATSGNNDGPGGVHEDIIGSGFTVAVKTTAAARNSPTSGRISGRPSITVSTRSNHSHNYNSCSTRGGAGRDSRSGLVAASYDHSHFRSDGGFAWGVEGEEEWPEPRLSGASVCDNPYVQRQCPPASSINRNRANSVLCPRRSTGFWPTTTNSTAAAAGPAALSLSTSLSSVSPVLQFQRPRSTSARQRSVSVQSSRSSPMTHHSFSGPYEPTGAFFSPNPNHLVGLPLSHPVAHALDDISVRRSSCNFDVDSVLPSHYGAEEHQSPRSLASGADFLRLNTLQHGTFNASFASLASWSTARASSHAAQHKSELPDIDYDGEWCKLHGDDEDGEIEAYNVTLRPNDVKAPMMSDQADASLLERMRGDEEEEDKGDGGKQQQGYINNGEKMIEPVASVTPRRSNTAHRQESPTHPPPPPPQQQQQQPQEEQNQIQEQYPQQPPPVDTVAVIHSSVLQWMMMNSTEEEVLCPLGFHFSVYDAEVQQHYTIESSSIVATRGAVRYLILSETYGAQSRFRFQLCKRYLHKRCTRGKNCQYIHARSVPTATWVHINENVISTAVMEGREASPEELQGGRNSHNYPTMPPGVMFRVYPPNQGKSVPQLIQSELILQTFGASNVYSVLANSNYSNNNNSSSSGADAGPLSGADESNTEAANLNNFKARHCAHFQFNKMCNLGASCNFIHSLVPFVQRLSSPGQNAVFHPVMAPATTAQPHFQLPPNAAVHYAPVQSPGGCASAYAMEVLQQPAVHLQPAEAAVATAPMAYHHVPVMQLPFYVPGPVPQPWNGYKGSTSHPYGGHRMEGYGSGGVYTPQRHDHFAKMPLN
ncbi:hypothetical protein DQ04_09631000 [Trypanosoma grayi]|uniref:hypothetical protein n=1 Tax=Trypanosoma grayi TaxID=71804 RepID=UPI0004F4B134|nr:hypothetical protein DQ04_09631000 [Trypanosoma grayi]KEG07494.1 hypothetical protein DQ04_09631000 [Trypanosoma grayi]